MRLSAAAKNVMLDALDETQTAGAKYASLHNAYNNAGTGSTELSGGSPAYARKPATWNAAAGGAKGITTAIVFDVPASSSVRFIGFWDAVTGGNFLGMSPNGGGIPQDFVVPDASTDLLRSIAHGFVAGDSVVVWSVPGDPLPTGLTEGGVYYVIASGFTTEDLRLSTTSGGTQIDLTTTGAGYMQKIVIELFGGQGTHTVTSVTMTMD